MALLVPRQFPGIEQCLFKLIAADMNVTTDQVFSPVFGFNPAACIFRLSRISATKARTTATGATTTSLDTAAGGVYDTASKGGTTLVAAAQAYSTLTGITLGLDLTLTAYAIGERSNTPILALTSGQGAAGYTDMYAFGYILTGL